MDFHWFGRGWTDCCVVHIPNVCQGFFFLLMFVVCFCGVGVSPSFALLLFAGLCFGNRIVTSACLLLNFHLLACTCRWCGRVMILFIFVLYRSTNRFMCECFLLLKVISHETNKEIWKYIVMTSVEWSLVFIIITFGCCAVKAVLQWVFSLIYVRELINSQLRPFSLFSLNTCLKYLIYRISHQKKLRRLVNKFSVKPLLS